MSLIILRKKKMIKEPNDQITYLAELTGSARPLPSLDWGPQYRKEFSSFSSAFVLAVVHLMPPCSYKMYRTERKTV